METQKQTVKEQSADDGGEAQRDGLVGFHEPIVVNRRRDSADVDQAMKHLPLFAAQTADHSAGRSDGKRNQEQENAVNPAVINGSFIDIPPMFSEKSKDLSSQT